MCVSKTFHPWQRRMEKSALGWLHLTKKEKSEQRTFEASLLYTRCVCVKSWVICSLVGPAPEANFANFPRRKINGRVQICSQNDGRTYPMSD